MADIHGLFCQAVAFGKTLHVSGRDRDEMEAVLRGVLGPEHRWEPIASGLEDVFISLMRQAEDNFR